MESWEMEDEKVDQIFKRDGKDTVSYRNSVKEVMVAIEKIWKMFCGDTYVMKRSCSTLAIILYL